MWSWTPLKPSLRSAYPLIISPASAEGVMSTFAAPASNVPLSAAAASRSDVPIKRIARTRSEEHTSELQSRLHLVCRLLLEKKKTSTDMQSPAHPGYRGRA